MEVFRKCDRLLKRTDYQRVQSRGVKVYGSFCLGVGLPGQTGCDRLGIVVTKKIHKRSVRRNKFKRHVREAFRKMSSRVLDVRRENFAKMPIDSLSQDRSLNVIACEELSVNNLEEDNPIGGKYELVKGRIGGCPVDGVIIARPSALEADYHKIASDLERVWEQLRRRLRASECPKQRYRR